MPVCGPTIPTVRRVHAVHREANRSGFVVYLHDPVMGRIPEVRTWRDAVVPALLVTTPLIGYSLIGDDRRRLYLAAHRFGSDPLEAFSHSWDTIDGFLDRGNFRPLGRGLENIERGFVFDAAEATGLAPNAVIGVLRLAIVAVLALVACRVVSAVVGSSGASPGRPHPAVVLYPMTLAATLVAADNDSPITKYPFVVVGSIVLILASALTVARDKDMQARPLSWHEAASMALLGAVAASTYDLLYLSPAVAAAFMVARHAASGRPARELLGSAALRRWAFLCIGFLGVFVPVRIMIATRCSREPCYSASDIRMSGDAVRTTADRLLTGAPPAGWSHASEFVRESGLVFGLRELLANGLLALVAATMLFIAVRSALHLNRRAPDLQRDETEWRRPAAGLVALGGSVALLSALLAGLSNMLQTWAHLPVGSAWRETVLVQVGWSFMASAALVAMFGIARTQRASRVAAASAPAILAICMLLTLLSNARLNQIDRNTPLHAVSNEIATATVHFDPTAEGNARRCRMIDDYTLFHGQPDKWLSGPAVHAELDTLMLERRGIPFCDPARVDGP